MLPIVLPPVDEASFAEALPNSGGVAAAQQRAQAARQRVRPVTSLLAPRVDLEMRKNLGDRTSPRLTTQTDRSVQIVARWEMGVGGESQARRNEGERRAEATEAEAERLLRETRAELLSLQPRLAQTERSVEQLSRQVERYDALVRAGELQFEAGRRSLTQLVQLQDSRFNAEQRLAEAAGRLLQTRLRQRALAGTLLPALGLPAQ